jgi:hypothetical protein
MPDRPRKRRTIALLLKNRITHHKVVSMQHQAASALNQTQTRSKLKPQQGL